MVKPTFTPELLGRIPPLTLVDTTCGRSEWATCVVVSRALDTYDDALRANFDPAIVEQTRGVAAARVAWQSLDGEVAELAEGLQEVRTYKIDASTDETGAIRPWAPLWERMSRVLRTTALVRRPSADARVRIMHQRQLELRERAEEVALHHAGPVPEFGGTDARMIVAAALACQAALSEEPSLRIEAADVLVLDYGDAMHMLAAVGSVATPTADVQ
jgi:hypothetical protein